MNWLSIVIFIIEVLLYLYKKINDNYKILTFYEYFNVNNAKKEYYVKNENKNYKLKVQDQYYEFDCQEYETYLFLVFDKPVYITGQYCRRIIALDIIAKSNKNYYLSLCIANNIIINNNFSYYEINSSKINNIYFYGSNVRFWSSQVGNFYIYNKYLIFDNSSFFLKHHKIKCFGKCDDLKKKILTSERFEEGIVHIE